MRDVWDDGRKVLKILWVYYVGIGKLRVILLYMELILFVKLEYEIVIDYVIWVEIVVIVFRNVGEIVIDSLFIVMVFKGLLEEYKLFVVVVI